MLMFNIHNWIDLTLVDILDILVVAFVTYWIILLIKGTRAVHMIAGLAIVFIAYVISRILPMYTLHWILNSFLSSIIFRFQVCSNQTQAPQLLPLLVKPSHRDHEALH